VRLKVDVNASVAGEVITLGGLGRASGPLALERKGSGALATDVNGGDVLVQSLGALKDGSALEPSTLVYLLLNPGGRDDHSAKGKKGEVSGSS
jgi:hypothetical protein